LANTIVAIDDEESIRRLVKLALEAEGYICHIAANGEEGLRKIREVNPDLVLCDVMMAKMDGFEVVDAMRKDPKLKETVIVMLSARDKELGTLDGRKDPPEVNEYLSKPFDLKELLAVVKKYLG
jgi:DNA-binding response OmpR family regulator